MDRCDQRHFLQRTWEHPDRHFCQTVQCARLLQSPPGLIWASCPCCKRLLRSMKTCMKISTVIWPAKSVAQATGHSRLSQGCVFSLGLSRSYEGQALETNLDKPEVSR